MNKPGVSVIIATYNNLGVTRMCLAQLSQYMPADCEVIVVDNGSTDGTVPWLMRQPKVRLLRNASNLGLAAAWNLGISKSRGELLMLMHNDVLVTRDTFSALRDALMSDGRLGMVAPYTYRCSLQQQRIFPAPSYTDLSGLQPFADRLAAKDVAMQPTLLLANFCLMLRRSAYDIVGAFDERYAVPSYETWDYSLRLARAGKFAAVINNYVHHEPGSFAVNGMDRERIDTEELPRLMGVYGFYPAYYSTSRYDLLRMLDAGRAGLRVLELGCGAGGTLLELRFEHPAAHIYGLELNPQTAEIARHFADEVRVVNLDTWEVPDEWRGKFDYVIAGDVIEHLRDTERILGEIRELLKVGGALVASLPNVQHIGVVRDLLNGEWNYVDAGILDRTHLRFFTGRSVAGLMAAARLRVESLESNLEYMSQEETRLLDWLTSDASPVKAPRRLFETYQWRVKAVKEQP